MADRLTSCSSDMGARPATAAAPQDGATVFTIDDTTPPTRGSRARADVDVASRVAEAFVPTCRRCAPAGAWSSAPPAGSRCRRGAGGRGRRRVGAVVSEIPVGAAAMDAIRAGREAVRAADLYAPSSRDPHAAKKDAPSGTALLLKGALERGGFPRLVDVASTRVGFVPGIHSVGFDGPAETVTLTHTVRDRATFAHGALVAARWVRGRRGWFTMRDVLEV